MTFWLALKPVLQVCSGTLVKPLPTHRMRTVTVPFRYHHEEWNRRKGTP